MVEPYIVYNPIRFRVQNKSECAPNCVCTVIEKLYQLKGIELDLDADLMDNEMRTFYNKDEGNGFSAERIFIYVKGHGIKDKISGKYFKITKWKTVSFEILRDSLFKYGVIYLHTKASTHKVNINKKIATVKEIKPNKYHARALFSMTDYYGIVDNNYKHEYFMDEKDFKKIFIDGWNIII